MDQALLEGEDMKAVVIDEFGAPDVLHVVDRELPEPGTGQVRLRVWAAGVNPLDGKIRSGAAQQMFPTRLPAVLGLEIAGTVDAVGPGVDGLAVGDDVLGFADGGGYAEYALATAAAPKPEGLGWAAAAALPVAAETALRVLGLLEVARGDTVLIHGAAGAVRRGPLGAALRCHDRSLAGLHDACGRIVAFPQEDQRIHDGLWPDDTSRIRHHIAAVSFSH